MVLASRFLLLSTREEVHMTWFCWSKAQRVAGIFIAPLIMLAGLWLCLEGAPIKVTDI